MQVLYDDEVYEAIAPAFHCVLIDALNGALKEHGVADASVRRQICDTFIFEASVLLDQSWVKTKGTKKLFPRVCFADRQLQEDEEADAKAKLYLPCGGFEFHSYSHGDVAYYFEECKEKLKDMKAGA
jgi:hypothetical protein